MRCDKHDQPSLLISCFQAGFGDQLIATWLMQQLRQCSEYPVAVAVLPAERPGWVIRALSDFHIWTFARCWHPANTVEIEKYDHIVSTAAMSFGVRHVDALGPNGIPTQGDWSRCDTELYSRIASLARQGIYPQCPITPAAEAETEDWLRRNGLLNPKNIIIIHARSEKTHAHKNPASHSIVALAKLLLAELPISVLILGNPADYGTLASARCLVCSGFIPLPSLAGIFRRSCVFVGSDSGPRHLAAMLGTHIVALDHPRHKDCGPYASPDRLHHVCVDFDGLKDSPFSFSPRIVADTVRYALQERIR
jgi:hypothetical protein